MFNDLISGPSRRQVGDSLAAAQSRSALAARLAGLERDDQHRRAARSGAVAHGHGARPADTGVDRTGSGVLRSRLRLADRRRAAQPAQGRDWSDPVTDADLRLSRTRPRWPSTSAPNSAAKSSRRRRPVRWTRSCSAWWRRFRSSAFVRRGCSTCCSISRTMAPPAPPATRRGRRTGGTHPGHRGHGSAGPARGVQ